MASVVRMNGKSVQITGIYRRSIAQPDGPALVEVEIVAMPRGGMAHRSFLTVIEQGAIHLAIPEGPTLETAVTASTWSSSGAGEASIFRHDVTLREIPEGAARRAAAADALAAEQAQADELDPEPDVAPDEDDRHDADNFSAVGSTTSGAVWATALQQLQQKRTGATVPEPPLETAELSGIEAVLVGLRLEALLDTLQQAGVIRRSAVDDTFLRLIGERFVTEATPVVGDKAARRALRDLL